MGIIRDDEEEEPISYCPHCLEYNQYRVLQERVQLIGETLSQSDRESFRQCHSCGLLVPVYELKQESKLQDFVESSSNPFDSGRSITGLDNKKKLTPTQKQRKKQKEVIDKEKDFRYQTRIKEREYCTSNRRFYGLLKHWWVLEDTKIGPPA
jgi:hypothetical protein